ncbi:MAG TPA: hypothetical protein VHG69_06670 [Thermoleophilaceae bacterium]|nr:hypothetical protein [Thermoleophilaceae bacterium]
MSRRGCSILVAAFFGLVLAAPAHGASMVFVKRGDVFMARPDGSRQVPITRNGTPGRPYFSPSIADNGTIVALRGIHLHSFRPNGRRIIRPRQWAVLGPNLWTEPFTVDLSPNGRVVATDNALYSTAYDPRRSENRPSRTALFVDFVDFRTNGAKGESDSFYDYAGPSWVGSNSVLTTSYGLFNAQILQVRVGRRSRGTEFYRDPARDPNTGTNAIEMADVEMTRRRDKFAVERRPVQGANSLRDGTIQIFRTGSPTTNSEPRCTIGPGRRIDRAPDPSWSPDGRTLYWHEIGRGIFSSRVTSAAGCGLRPRRIVGGALSPDLSRANVPRRR